MEFNKKDYELMQIKKYLKFNKLFFFFNGTNKNSNKWLLTEQHLKNIGYKSYKTTNKITIKALNSSIYTNVKPIISGMTFIISPFTNSHNLSRNIFQKNFEPLLLLVLAVKLNNKIYSSKQIKNLNSFNYKTNKLVLYQFATTNIKNYYK